MAMTLLQLIDKLNLLQDELQKEIPRILDIVSHDGLALLLDRLEKKGVEGAEYDPEYRDFKIKKHGADAVRVVNLRLESRMLTNLQVIDRSVSDNVFHSGIGNTTDEENDKMEGNIKRYSDKFLNMTDDEKAILNQTAQYEFDLIIKRIFS